MDKSLALSLGSAACGTLSFATLLLEKGDTPLAHALANATWGLIVGAVVLALLAADSAKDRRVVKALIGVGVLAAAARAALAFT